MVEPATVVDLREARIAAEIIDVGSGERVGGRGISDEPQVRGCLTVADVRAVDPSHQSRFRARPRAAPPRRLEPRLAALYELSHVMHDLASPQRFGAGAVEAAGNCRW